MGGNENECTCLKVIGLVFTFSWLATPWKLMMQTSCAYRGLFAMNVLALFLRSNIFFKREQYDSTECAIFQALLLFKSYFILFCLGGMQYMVSCYFLC